MKLLLVRVLLWAFFLLLVGCMEGEFTAIHEEAFTEGSSSEEDSLSTEEEEDFSKGKFVSNCLEIPVDGANACIFGKNPVSDVGQSLAHPPVVNVGSVLAGQSEKIYGLTDMSAFQTYAVKIPGEALESDNFMVDYSILGSSISTSKNTEGEWKYPFNNDSNISVINTHLFFWLNHLAKVVKDITGNFYPEGGKISIIPLVPFIDLVRKFVHLLMPFGPTVIETSWLLVSLNK